MAFSASANCDLSKLKKIREGIEKHVNQPDRPSRIEGMMTIPGFYKPGRHEVLIVTWRTHLATPVVNMTKSFEEACRNGKSVIDWDFLAGTKNTCITSCQDSLAPRKKKFKRDPRLGIVNHLSDNMLPSTELDPAFCGRCQRYADYLTSLHEIKTNIETKPAKTKKRRVPSKATAQKVSTRHPSSNKSPTSR